ncbi:MAG: DUF2911 domain-containing protein [Calditrichaeota bacterium]|nr:MAG: DUF2911 domain-containing protein [Calditrichota bacterium]
MISSKIQKVNLLIISTVLFSLLFLNQGFAHGKNRGTATAKIGEKAISVDYGRPSWGKVDRLSQAPEGFVWRMGMDKATHFTSEVDLVFGEKIIPKGTYTLFMRHITADKWHLIVNKQTGQWGSNYDKKQDFVVIPLTMEKTEKQVEKMTIEISTEKKGHGTLSLLWGPYVISSKFLVKK